MSRRSKALVRLQEKPKDFTWDELRLVMEGFGYELRTGQGSRRKFVNRLSNAVVALHEPHPQPILKHYQIQAILEHLKERGLL